MWYWHDPVQIRPEQIFAVDVISIPIDMTVEGGVCYLTEAGSWLSVGWGELLLSESIRVASTTVASRTMSSTEKHTGLQTGNKKDCFSSEPSSPANKTSLNCTDKYYNHFAAAFVNYTQFWHHTNAVIWNMNVWKGNDTYFPAAPKWTDTWRECDSAKDKKP